MNVSVSREEFDALRAEVVELRKRLSALAPEPGPDEETVQIIAAAVAAYLGKRAQIKLIRRVNQDEAPGWGAQGRTSIAASHQMPMTRGW